MNERIDVVQLGARMHYAVPAYFAQKNLLNKLFTDIWAPKLPLFSSLKSIPPYRLVASRQHSGIKSSLVSHFPLLGFLYAHALKKATNREEETQVFLDFSERFQQKILQKSATQANVLYAFNTVAKHLFLSERYQTSFKILEQTLVPRKAEYQYLKDEYHFFGVNLSRGKASENYELLELEECSLADLVITGSTFVRDSLVHLGIPSSKIEVVPYGFTSEFGFGQPKKFESKLRILFAGNGGIRKGLRFALEAVSGLKFVELTVAGRMESVIAQLPLSENVHFVGPVDRLQMSKLFLSHDVLVLPSLCEGSATVTYEAMAFGLPVIATPNAGTVIEHNREGWIVPTHSSSEIRATLEHILDVPDELFNKSEAALKTAKEFTMERYGERLWTCIQKNKARIG